MWFYYNRVEVVRRIRKYLLRRPCPCCRKRMPVVEHMPFCDVCWHSLVTVVQKDVLRQQRVAAYWGS